MYVTLQLQFCWRWLGPTARVGCTPQLIRHSINSQRAALHPSQGGTVYSAGSVAAAVYYMIAPEPVPKRITHEIVTGNTKNVAGLGGVICLF
jgi:hypothetical protein